MVYEIIDRKTGIEVAKIYTRKNKLILRKSYTPDDLIGQSVDDIMRIVKDLGKIRTLVITINKFNELEEEEKPKKRGRRKWSGRSGKH